MYRVEYNPDEWKPCAPQHNGVGHWQVVVQSLDGGRRLYVELTRYPWEDSPGVRLACIEAAWTDKWGAQRWRSVERLGADAIAIVSNEAARTT